MLATAEPTVQMHYTSTRCLPVNHHVSIAITLQINMCNYVVLEVVNCLLGEGHAAFRAPDMDPGTLQRALGRGYAQTAAMLKWWEATWGHYLDGFAECLADGSYGRRLWTSHAQARSGVDDGDTQHRAVLWWLIKY